MSMRLYINGVGVAHALGDWDKLAACAANGQRAGKAAPAPDVDLAPLAQLVAEHLPGVSLRRIPRYARLALLAHLQTRTSQKENSAIIPAKDIAPARKALVVATAHAGAAMSCDFMDSVLESGLNLASPMAFSHAVNNMGAGLLSLLLNVRGPCHTLMNSAMSFASALETAGLLLHEGQVDLVWLCVVDEAEARLSATAPELFCTPDGAMNADEGAICFELRAWPQQDQVQGQGLYISLPEWAVPSKSVPDNSAPEAKCPQPSTLPLYHALQVALALHGLADTECCLHIGGTEHLQCTVTVGKESCDAAC